MAIKYSGSNYNGGSSSYVKGYSGKGGRNGRKNNNFLSVIIVIVLIIAAIIVYCSVDSDKNEIEDGETVVATAAPTVKSTAVPTEEPEDDMVISTPSPTLTADDTVKEYDMENVPTAKPRATAKPKPTEAPAQKPAVTPVPTNIPSSQYGTAYVNKYYSSGIYVRSGAGKENSVVLHILRDDHTTRLVPTGNSQADDYGYTWLEVTVPSGATGWVRSDVVAQQ